VDWKQNTPLNSSSVVTCIFVATGMCVHRTLSCNGLFCVATGMRVYCSNLALASHCPTMNFHSDFTIQAFRLSGTHVVTGTCLMKHCSAMDYSGCKASRHNMQQLKSVLWYYLHNVSIKVSVTGSFITQQLRVFFILSELYLIFRLQKEMVSTC
jgi:hypothetical protein